jgi:hypothetical protein
MGEGHLVAQVSHQQGFGKADYYEEDFYNPEEHGPVDPDDGLPVNDGIVLKLLRRLLVGHQVFRLVAHLAFVAARQETFHQRPTSRVHQSDRTAGELMMLTNRNRCHTPGAHQRPKGVSNDQ